MAPGRRARSASAEPRKEMPDAFEVLVVVLTGLPCGPERARVEDVVDRQLCAEGREPGAAVVRVTRQFVDGDAEAGVPLDGAAQDVRGGLDRGAPMAGAEHHRLDIVGKPDRAVDVGFDVVVEWIIGTLRVGPRDQVHPLCNAEVGRGEDAVRMAEGRARQHRDAQPQMGRAETRCSADRVLPEVQRAVDRAQTAGQSS